MAGVNRALQSGPIFALPCSAFRIFLVALVVRPSQENIQTALAGDNTSHSTGYQPDTRVSC